MKLFIIASGGAVGALMRYYGSMFFSGGSVAFPMGTLFVNLTGAFIIGFVWGVAEFGTLTENMKALVMTGILGSFTTFSTYSLETVNLMRDGQHKLAALNMFGSVFSGILLAYVGYLVSKFIVQTFIL